jgi:radical SAM protein with 4Fe4S-binding SPASM domain
MDGTRSIEEVGGLWAMLTSKPHSYGVEAVMSVVNRFTSGKREHNDILIKVDDTNRRNIRQYNPEDFVIAADKVNLSERRLRIPHIIHYMPTLLCPQNCVYCYAKRSPILESDALSMERLREVFEELAGLGVEAIQLTGGDPMVHPKMLEIMEMVRSFGMAIELPTKLGLSREKASRLIDIGINEIQISLDSSDPQTLDYMVGVTNYHRKVFQCLDYLREIGMRVRINSVLTSHNISQVGNLLDYLGSFSNIFRVTLSPYGRSMWCHNDANFISENDLLRVQAEADKRIASFPHMQIIVGGIAAKPPVNFQERYDAWEARAQCSGNRDGFVILPNGQVTVCEGLYDHPSFLIGNLATQSVMEVWESPEAKALIYPDQTTVPDGPCRTCSTFVQCHSQRGRCWRDVVKAYGCDKHYYPDPRCPSAPQGALRLG